MPAVAVSKPSKRFNERAAVLFHSQENRAKTKYDKNNRITRKGYILPFGRLEFMAWFLAQFGGQEGSVQYCTYCRRPIDAYSCVVDHKNPLGRWGSPDLGNLEVICATCNDIKGQLTAQEFTYFLTLMLDMSIKFGGQAVTNITSRLESHTRLATSLRHQMGKRRRNVAGAMGIGAAPAALEEAPF